MAPLTGIRVLDLTRFVSGPFCTMTMGDMGADVIKVEQPGTGDGTRKWTEGKKTENNPYFMAVNRSKRSITCNLAHPRGQELVKRLAKISDVMIANFIPGTLEKFGLGYDDMKKVNPRLIYCDISGYGNYGPYADRPAFDFTMQSESGLMSLVGEPDGPVYKVGFPVLDVLTSLTACSGILSAVIERNRTGVGRRISVAMYDTALLCMANVVSDYIVDGRIPQRWGTAHPNLAPYEGYEASDGWIAIGIATEPQWRRFCELMNRSDLAKDPRFATNPDRLVHRVELNEILRPIVKTRPGAEWLAALKEAGAPCSPINDIPTVIADEHTKVRELVQKIDHPIHGEMNMIRSPIILDSQLGKIPRHPPMLGQHTDEVLTEVLGMTAEEIASLREGKAI